MSQPLVSVIIPVYNHENYVVQALESVYNQSYPNIEVIIIDDGSKDQSPRVVEQYLESLNGKPSYRPTTFLKQENAGAHQTINNGLDLAKGDYLTILNSDDYYHPNRIQSLIDQVASKGKNLGFSKVTYIDEHGSELPKTHRWSVWYEGIWIDLVTNCPTVGFGLLQSNMAVSTGNLFFSRTLYKKVGPFNNYKLVHDFDFLLRALIFEEPILLEQNLYYYRVHPANTFTQVQHLTFLELNQIFFEYLSQVAKAPPENPQAPCHWYWPHLFPSFFKQIQINVGFRLPLDKKETFTNCLPPSISSKPAKKLSLKNTKGKISLISHELSLTGGPKLIADLALSLKSHGYQPHVFSLADGPMRAEIEKWGIPCTVIPTLISSWYKNANKLKRRYTQLLCMAYLFFKAGRTVLCNTAVTWNIVMPLTIFSPFSKLYWYIHDSSSPTSLFPQITAPKYIKNAQKNYKLDILFGSKSTQEIWQASGYNGTVQYWSGIPQLPLTASYNKPHITNILSVGSISPRKGTHYLIDAFISGVKAGSIKNDVSLTIIGYDPHLLLYDFINEIILKIIRHNLQDRIKIIESVQPDELDAYYDQADLYVHSSVLECLPIAILNAMARGIPIVTTDANGCVEVIENGRTGYICANRDLQELTQTLATAINHPARTKELGKQGRTLFNQKFCLQENEKGLLNLLKLA